MKKVLTLLGLLLVSTSAVAEPNWQKVQTIVIIQKTWSRAYSVCLEYKEEIPQCNSWYKNDYQCICNKTDHKKAYLTIYKNLGN